ncbi:chascon isoform d-related [Anaeramoeba flamelloides]|uniref:Chascon isoform d-related n=1 Tax=Anaeramoeba flamelloides TaxID=1746091 RepID=A0AAV7YMA0_9EUKA|nr:chascon isoform d-related [Anaeramoeba flamelloides]
MGHISLIFQTNDEDNLDSFLDGFEKKFKKQISYLPRSDKQETEPIQKLKNLTKILTEDLCNLKSFPTTYNSICEKENENGKEKEKETAKNKSHSEKEKEKEKENETSFEEDEEKYKITKSKLSIQNNINKELEEEKEKEQENENENEKEKEKVKGKEINSNKYFEVKLARFIINFVTSWFHKNKSLYHIGNTENSYQRIYSSENGFFQTIKNFFFLFQQQIFETAQFLRLIPISNPSIVYNKAVSFLNLQFSIFEKRLLKNKDKYYKKLYELECEVNKENGSTKDISDQKKSDEEKDHQKIDHKNAEIQFGSLMNCCSQSIMREAKNLFQTIDSQTSKYLHFLGICNIQQNEQEKIQKMKTKIIQNKNLLLNVLEKKVLKFSIQYSLDTLKIMKRVIKHTER